MRREWKIGIVVAGSFVCLIGGVFAVKHFQGAPPEAPVAQAPEKQPDEPSHTETSSTPLYRPGETSSGPTLESDMPPPPPPPPAVDLPGVKPPNKNDSFGPPPLDPPGKAARPGTTRIDDPAVDDDFNPPPTPSKPAVRRVGHEEPAGPPPLELPGAPPKAAAAPKKTEPLDPPLELPAPGGVSKDPKLDKGPPALDLPAPPMNDAGKPSQPMLKGAAPGLSLPPAGNDKPMLPAPPPAPEIKKGSPPVDLPPPGGSPLDLPPPVISGPMNDKPRTAAPMGDKIGPDLEPPPIIGVKPKTEPKPPADKPAPKGTLDLPPGLPKPMNDTPSIGPGPVVKPAEPMPHGNVGAAPINDRTPPPAGPPAALGERPMPAIGAEPRVDSYDEEWYYCKQGDTLEAISQKFFFTPKYEQALRLYNLDRNYSAVFRQDRPALAQGQVVKVPPARILEKSYPEKVPGFRPASNPPPGDPAGAAETSSTAGNSDNQLGAPREFLVRRDGMTLRDIAKEELHDANQWTRIFMLNREVNPSAVLPVGTRIYLPRAQ